VLIAREGADEIWKHRHLNGDLHVTLLGGGSAVFPGREVYMMTPRRRARLVAATTEVSS